METEDASRDSVDLFFFGAESSRLGASQAAKVSFFFYILRFSRKVIEIIFTNIHQEGGSTVNGTGDEYYGLSEPNYSF
jgi:hypothetical protein